jgi:hypothetical protein
MRNRQPKPQPLLGKRQRDGVPHWKKLLPGWRIRVLRKKLEADRKMATVPATPVVSVAPEVTSTDGYRAFLDRLTITPGTSSPETEQRWKEEWKRIMAKPDDDVEKIAMQQLYSEEGVQWYVDIDLGAEYDVFCAQVIVNVCYFLYITDEEGLGKDWDDVKRLYDAFQHGTPLSDIDVDMSDAQESAMLVSDEDSIGAAYTIDSTTPEGMPRWTPGLTRGTAQASMLTFKNVLRTVVIGTGAAAAGTAAATATTALMPLLVGTGLVGSAVTAIGGTAASLGFAAVGAKATELAMQGASNVLTATACGVSDFLFAGEVNLAFNDYVTYQDQFYKVANPGKHAQALSDLGRWLLDYRNYLGVAGTELGDGASVAAIQEKAKEMASQSADKILNKRGPVQELLVAPQNVKGDVAAGLFKKFHFSSAVKGDQYVGHISSDKVRASMEGELGKSIHWKAWLFGVSDEARAETASKTFEAIHGAGASKAGLLKTLVQEHGFQIALSLLTGFMKQRHMKEKLSIEWLNNMLALNNQKAMLTYRAPGVERDTKFLCYFDQLMRDRHLAICKADDRFIKKYLTDDRAKGKGIIRDGAPTDAPKGLAEAFQAPKLRQDLVDQYCTTNPDEERATVIKKLAQLLVEIRDELENAVGQKWQEQQQNNWWEFSVAGTMKNLEPAVDEWVEADQRLFNERFRRLPRPRGYKYEAPPNVQERRFKQADGLCAQFMTEQQLEDEYETELLERARIAAQRAIQEDDVLTEVQAAAAAAVKSAAETYGFSQKRVQDYAKWARDYARNKFNDKQRAESERLKEARKEDLENAKTDAERAGKEKADELAGDETITEEDLANKVADAAYTAAIYYDTITRSKALELAKKAAKAALTERAKARATEERERAKEAAAEERRRAKAAADEERQQAKDEAERKRAEARAKAEAERLKKKEEAETKKREDARKREEEREQKKADAAAAKAAAAEEARQNAPTRVMELVEARAAAREEARKFANEFLDANGDEVDPVELEGLAALAAAEKVRKDYSSVPQQGIRQVGIEAARAALREREARAAGNDGRDPDEPQLAPLGAAGPVRINDAEVANIVQGMGASASVVADVFARLSL